MNKFFLMAIIFFLVGTVAAQSKRDSTFKVGISHEAGVLFDVVSKLRVSDKGFHTRTCWNSFKRNKPELIAYSSVTSISKDVVNEKGDFFFVFETKEKVYRLGYNTRKDRRRFLILVSQYLPELMKEGDLYIEK